MALPLSTLGRVATAVVIVCSAIPGRAETKQQRAHDLFERSAELYERGKLEQSADLLRQAYALDPNPVLVYNLARVEEGLGKLADAVADYRRFLELEPTTPDRAAIEKRIQSLEQQITERAALIERARRARQREQEAAQRARSAEHRPSPVPWLIAAAGGAGLASGAVLGWLALRAESDARKEPTFFGAQKARDRAETLALAANLSFVTGGVLTVAGVSWGLLAWPSKGSERATVGVALHGAF